MYFLCGHIGILKKMTSSFRKGGRGQPKDDSGLCGGRGGLKPLKKDDVIF